MPDKEKQPKKLLLGDSEKIKTSPEMIKFEEVTGKKAIWDGKITEQFKKWEKGEKIYKKSKNEIRWTVYTKPELNEKWSIFKKTHNYNKAEFIRNAINYFINHSLQVEGFGKNSDYDILDKLTSDAIELFLDETRVSNSEISNDLKQSLTPLKAYIQLSIDLISKIVGGEEEEALKFLLDAKNINIELENKIKKYFDKPSIAKKLIEPKYDILYVEDDEATANAIITYVNKKGFKIKHIKTAKESIEELRFHKPKVLLIDIGLPGKLQGDLLYKKLKSNEDNKDITFIFITAKPPQEVEKIMRDTQVNEIINKPFEFSDLDIIFKYLI